MGQKQFKADRKKIRKEIRAKFGDGMGVLGEMVRPRPRWIPKRIWIYAYLPLFPRRYLHIIHKYLD